MANNFKNFKHNLKRLVEDNDILEDLDVAEILEEDQKVCRQKYKHTKKIDKDDDDRST